MNKFLISMGRSALAWFTVFAVVFLLTLGCQWVKASYEYDPYNIAFAFRFAVLVGSIAFLASLGMSINREFK